MSRVFVTYDLEESGQAQPHEVYRGAHEVPIDAEAIVRWDSGEFKRAWGRDIYGVKIIFRRPGSSAVNEEEEVVEVPANAQNVNVYLSEVPPEYRAGLKSAA